MRAERDLAAKAAQASGEDAKKAKADQAEQEEQLVGFRKDQAARWKRSAALQPLGLEELRRQLDESCGKYSAAVSEGQWLTAVSLSERSKELTEAIRDALDHAVGRNG